MSDKKLKKKTPGLGTGGGGGGKGGLDPPFQQLFAAAVSFNNTTNNTTHLLMHFPSKYFYRCSVSQIIFINGTSRDKQV